MNDAIINRKLLIQFQTGINKDGKDILKTKTFNNIRLDSTEDNLSKFPPTIVNYLDIVTSKH